ncbi:MAG: tetratricopeptide repeat protein [Fibrobacteria bacterium]
MNTALAILAPATFLALLEAIFALAGVQPIFLTEDPLVGFTGLQPLFVEAPAESGAFLRTNPAKLNHFNFQSFPRMKPAGAYRIFAVGGSTTYGHPWRDPVSYCGWLRELLPAADSSRAWEVINAGGISYASYREAKLIEEIARYQPDLILVYSGHNEFLEERTYRKVAAIPGPLRAFSSLLDHTRTFTVMRRALRRAKPGSTAESPAKDDRPSLSPEVDEVLARTIGPETYVRDDSLRAGVLEHYRISLERMAALAKSAGARVLFLTTPANERDCTPFKSESTPGIRPEDRAAVTLALGVADSLETAGRHAELSVMLDSIVLRDPRNADLLYRAGKAAMAAGRYAEAKRLLVRALEEDVCPLRALPTMRDIVRDVAQRTGSELLDVTASLEQKTRARLGHDILGEPEFVDHVHLSIDEYRAIAMQVIGKLAALGEAKPKAGWGEVDERAVAQRVMAGMGSHELGEGLHNIAKLLNWSGKHEDAARVAIQALAVDSTGLEAIWSSIFAGAALERRGLSDLAVPHFRRAFHLDTTNEMSRGYLRHALSLAGFPPEAALEAGSGDPGAAAQASALLQEGRVREALALLQGIAAATSGDQTLLILLGESQRRLGQALAATSSFQAALVADPKEARAYLGLARIAEDRGEVSEASFLYAKALALRPDLTEARAALVRTLQGRHAPP